MVTSEGYVRRTYEEILAAKIQKAQELFGSDINTDGNTPLGKYIRINAYDQSKVEEMAEKIYYSINPQTSFGQSLDRLGWTVAITRKAATHSVYSVRIAGTTGETVPIGFKVGTESGLTFHNLYNTPIGADGTCYLTVECDEAGTVGNVNANDILKIINPTPIVDEIFVNKEDGAVIYYNSCLISGEDEESDSDFLKRYEIAREGKGSCNEISLKAALLNIPSVKGVYIKVTEDEAENGIPAHSIACYVQGGDDEKIAEAIFNKKPIGIGTHGDINVPVSYGALNDYIVKFYRAENVSVYIQLELETDSTFDNTNNNGYNNIKSNLNKYIQNLGIGKPLILTALYQAVYSVKGVVSANITASRDGAQYSSANIEVEPYQVLYLNSLFVNGNEI